MHPSPTADNLDYSRERVAPLVGSEVSTWLPRPMLSVVSRVVDRHLSQAAQTRHAQQASVPSVEESPDEGVGKVVMLKAMHHLGSLGTFIEVLHTFQEALGQPAQPAQRFGRAALVAPELAADVKHEVLAAPSLYQREEASEQEKKKKLRFSL